MAEAVNVYSTVCLEKRYKAALPFQGEPVRSDHAVPTAAANSVMELIWQVSSLNEGNKDAVTYGALGQHTV